MQQPADDFYLRLLTAGEGRTPSYSVPEDDGLTAAMRLIAGNVLAWIEHNLKDEAMLARLRANPVSVVTVPRGRVQAAAIRRGPAHVIVMNYGLAMFVYRLARVFSRHVIVRGPDDPPAPPESDSVELIADILDWMASPVNAPLIAEDWPISDRELRTADNFATAAERFVIAHEIAHILEHHSLVAGDEVARGPVALEDADRHASDEEMAADTVGMVLTIESMMAEEISPLAGVVGMTFFLQALDAAEFMGAALVDDRHPAAGIRLAACLAAIDLRYGADAPKLKSWAVEFQQLFARLLAGSHALRQQRLAAATDRMNEIFETTAWHTFGGRDLQKDHELMLEVHELMDHAPSAVIKALGDNLLDEDAYAARVAAAATPGALDADDKWRRHQLAHFFARYARPQVQDVLGVQALPVFGSADQ